MARDRLVLLVGKTGEDNTILREFFAKVPEEEQNALAKKILATVIKYAGEGWDPVLEGYPFLRTENREQKTENRVATPPFIPVAEKVEVAEVVRVIPEPIAAPVVEKAALVVEKVAMPAKVMRPMASSRSDEDDDDAIPIATGIRRLGK